MKYLSEINTKKAFFIVSFLVFFFSVATGVQAQWGVPGGQNAVNRTGYACTTRYFDCSKNDDTRKSNLLEDIETRRIIPKKPQGYTYDKNDVLLRELKQIYGNDSQFVCYDSSQSSNIVDIAAPAHLVSSELRSKTSNPSYNSIVTQRAGKLFIDYINTDDTIIAAINATLGNDGSESGDQVEVAKTNLYKRILKAYASTGAEIFLDDVSQTPGQYANNLTQRLRITPSNNNSSFTFTIPDTRPTSSLLSEDGVYVDSANSMKIAVQDSQDIGLNLQNFIIQQLHPLLDNIDTPQEFDDFYERVENGDINRIDGTEFTDEESFILLALADSLKPVSDYYLVFKDSGGSGFENFDLQPFSEVVEYESNSTASGGNLDISSFDALVAQLHSGNHTEALEILRNNLSGGYEDYINQPHVQKELFAGEELAVVYNSLSNKAQIGTAESCKNTGGCALVLNNGNPANPDGSVRGIAKTQDSNFYVLKSEHIREYTQENSQQFGELNCQRCYFNGEAMAVEKLAEDKFNVYICDTSAEGNVRVKESVGSLEATLGSLITDPTNQPLYDACFQSGGIYTAIGCVDPTPIGLITGLIRIALGVIGGVALLQLIYVGIQYQLGDEAKIKEARSRLIATITGVAVLVFSILILRIIGVNVLDILPVGAI